MQVRGLAGGRSLQGASTRCLRYRVRDGAWNFSMWLGAWLILSSEDEVNDAFLKISVLFLSPPTPPLPTRARTHTFPRARGRQ